MTARDWAGSAADGRERLSWLTLLAFGSISMPVSLLAIGVFMFLPTVYAANNRVSMEEVGVVIFATRLWDFVTDPLVGWLSDKTRTRFGRRLPWMTLAWLPLSVAVYKLFLPPPEVDVVYLAFWSFALFLAGTALFMPYSAMGAELSPAYHQRSRVFAVRHVFSVLGTLTAALLFWSVTKSAIRLPEADALRLIALVGLALLPLCLLATLLKVPEPPLNAARARHDIRWREGARIMLGNRIFLRVLGCYLCNGIANALPVTLVFFFVRSVLAAPERTPEILALYFAAAICGTPLWLYLARQRGKHVAWRIALVVAAATLGFVPLLGAGDVAWFAVIALILGLTLGADLAMPAAMLADVVDQDVLATGQTRTGIYFAVWAMAAKLAAALAVGVSFPVLGWAGFAPMAANGGFALLVLSVLFGLCPMAFKLAALAIVWRYPLTAAQQAQLRRDIAARTE